MKKINFTYSGSKNDSSPEVLVTTQNQHKIRGFNTNYMTKGQATRLQNEWMRIKNQRWPMSTKERVLMERVGKPAKTSFRTYSTDKVSGKS